MDLLGDLRQEIGDEDDQDRKGALEARIRHAPALLLARLQTSLSSAHYFMTKPAFVSYTTHGINLSQFQEAFPLNEYRVVHDPSKIPLPLPTKLCDKSFRAVVVGSGDSTNCVYMINFSRLDGTAVDQQPFMLAYHSGDGTS